MSALLGVNVGAVVTAARDAVQSQPRLDFKWADTRERVWLARPDENGAWSSCEPAQATESS